MLNTVLRPFSEGESLIVNATLAAKLLGNVNVTPFITPRKSKAVVHVQQIGTCTIGHIHLEPLKANYFIWTPHCCISVLRLGFVGWYA